MLTPCCQHARATNKSQTDRRPEPGALAALQDPARGEASGETMMIKARTIASLSLLIPMTGAARQSDDPNQEEARMIENLGVYLVSSDLNRAEVFYRALFEVAPHLKTDVFLGFDVAGGMFAVVDRATFAPNAALGGNAIPYIRVSDIHASFAAAQAAAPEAMRSAKVLDEGPIQIFKLQDPDGNVIEFYSLSVD